MTGSFRAHRQRYIGVARNAASRRLHSALGYKNPGDFENQTNQTGRAAPSKTVRLSDTGSLLLPVAHPIVIGLWQSP